MQKQGDIERSCDLVFRTQVKEWRNMPVRIGTTELIIILVIVILLFGGGRIGKVAGELGRGIREFRENLAGDDEEEIHDE
jgi:sec-independent protein translocase protein TatA